MHGYRSGKRARNSRWTARAENNGGTSAPAKPSYRSQCGCVRFAGDDGPKGTKSIVVGKSDAAAVRWTRANFANRFARDFRRWLRSCGLNGERGHDVPNRWRSIETRVQERSQTIRYVMAVCVSRVKTSRQISSTNGNANECCDRSISTSFAMPSSI